MSFNFEILAKIWGQNFTQVNNEKSIIGSNNYVRNISKKKPTVKRLLAHINSPGANNWDESVVEESLCILRTKGIINESYKILRTNNTNTLLSYDELFKTTNNTTSIIHSAVTSVTPTSHSKENSNHNKHDLKDKHD